MTEEEVEQAYAEWTTAFINDLPDSAFLYIAPGGEKDDDGRTVPRSLRYFPYRDASGKVDLPHLRNAIAQAPKANLSRDIIAKVQAKGRELLEGEREEALDDYPEVDEEMQQARNMQQSKIEMSDWSDALRLDDVEIDKTVELARSGTHYGRASDRKVSLSAEDIESMSRGYALIKSEGWFSTGAPVGYNHAAISGALDAESTKAAGRIIDVHVRANEDGSVSLMGTVRWTEEAKRRIRAGEFDGFSIEAVPADGARSKKTGEKLGEWALIGGTLTNEPFVAGMQPVAASEKRNPDMGTSKISQALSLGESVTETEILAEIESLRERAAKADSLSEALDTVTEDRDTIKAKFEELEGKEIERMLDRACADGRIAASERDDYLDIYTHCGEERANRAYFLNRIGVTEVGKAGTDAERVQRHTVSAECNALAEKLSEEEGLDPAAAFARAMQVVLSDSTKLAAYEAENLDS
jgi:phage I-like protein